MINLNPIYITDKTKEKINKSLFLIYSKAEIQIVNLKNIKV